MFPGLLSRRNTSVTGREDMVGMVCEQTFRCSDFFK